MKDPRSPLNRTEPADLARQLEEWRVAVGAQSLCVLRCPKLDGCPCGTEVVGANAAFEARTVEGPCRLGTASQVIAEAGNQSSSISLLCLRSPLGDGSICSLQVGFGQSSIALPEVARLTTTLATPLLLWAAGLLNYETLQGVLAANEERSQADLHQAITALDEEREWIALEVHDRIAQTLASVFQQLQMVEGMTRSNPDIRQAVVRGSLLCREVIREARNIMNDLRPPVLEGLGLVPALQEELGHLAEETHCQVTQELTFDGHPPRAIELALYRIFREALVNTRRHASATAVSVSLTAQGSGVSLSFSDNGVGFDVEEALKKKRVGGLLSMRRRTEFVGGTYHLHSQPGLGTKVSVWLPLSPPPNPGDNVHLRS